MRGWLVLPFQADWLGAATVVIFLLPGSLLLLGAGLVLLGLVLLGMPQFC